MGMGCNECTKDSFVYRRSTRMDPNPNKSGISRPIKSLSFASSFPVTRQESPFYYREEASPLCISHKEQTTRPRPQYTMRKTMLRLNTMTLRIIHRCSFRNLGEFFWESSINKIWTTFIFCILVFENVSKIRVKFLCLYTFLFGKNFIFEYS